MFVEGNFNERIFLVILPITAKDCFSNTLIWRGFNACIRNIRAYEEACGRPAFTTWHYHEGPGMLHYWHDGNLSSHQNWRFSASDSRAWYSLPLQQVPATSPVRPQLGDWFFEHLRSRCNTLVHVIGLIRRQGIKPLQKPCTINIAQRRIRKIVDKNI